jgi:glycosyltransferase involved in cell wall biosynthesis
MKFALISNILPPSHTAHAAIINRLLRDRDPETYCLLSGRDYETGEQPAYSGRLAGRYYHLRTFRLTRGYRFGLAGVRARLNSLLDVPLRTVLIARILRREQCDAVVACTGSDELVDFAAGYLASRLTGARFYAYLLDQFSHMINFGLGESFLRHLEPMIMKGAAAVIVPNEFLAVQVRRQFSVEPMVIHNPCDLSSYEAARAGRPDASGNDDRIVYTGQVGTLHFAAFHNLLAAIDSLGRENTRLHLYTIQTRPYLEERGICGPVVFHQHAPLSAMPLIQGQANILFLPLAVHSSHPEIARTAAPGKMGEYLAARRPILVHAPADSFLAWYFRRHDCGLVVDRDDPAELAHALRRLLSDAGLCRRLSERAWERARADFSVTKARRQFDTLLAL